MNAPANILPRGFSFSINYKRGKQKGASFNSKIGNTSGNAKRKDSDPSGLKEAGLEVGKGDLLACCFKWRAAATMAGANEKERKARRGRVNPPRQARRGERNENGERKTRGREFISAK